MAEFNRAPNQLLSVLVAVLLIFSPIEARSSSTPANELFVNAVTLHRQAADLPPEGRDAKLREVRALFDQILAEHPDSDLAELIRSSPAPAGVVLADLPSIRSLGKKTAGRASHAVTENGSEMPDRYADDAAMRETNIASREPGAEESRLSEASSTRRTARYAEDGGNPKPSEKERLVLDFLATIHTGWSAGRTIQEDLNWIKQSDILYLTYERAGIDWLSVFGTSLTAIEVASALEAGDYGQGWRKLSEYAALELLSQNATANQLLGASNIASLAALPIDLGLRAFIHLVESKGFENQVKAYSIARDEVGLSHQEIVGNSKNSVLGSGIVYFGNNGFITDIISDGPSGTSSVPRLAAGPITRVDDSVPMFKVIRSIYEADQTESVVRRELTAALEHFRGIMADRREYEAVEGVANEPGPVSQSQSNLNQTTPAVHPSLDIELSSDDGFAPQLDTLPFPVPTRANQEGTWEVQSEPDVELNAGDNAWGFTVSDGGLASFLDQPLFADYRAPEPGYQRLAIFVDDAERHAIALFMRVGAERIALVDLEAETILNNAPRPFWRYGPTDDVIWDPSGNYAALRMPMAEYSTGLSIFELATGRYVTIPDREFNADARDNWLADSLERRSDGTVTVEVALQQLDDQGSPLASDSTASEIHILDLEEMFDERATGGNASRSAAYDPTSPQDELATGPNDRGQANQLELFEALPDGFYSTSPEVCAHQGESVVETFDRDFRSLSRPRLSMYDITCNIVEAKDAGAAVAVTVNCNAEGFFEERVYRWQVVGAQSFIEIADSGETATYQLCPMDSQAGELEASSTKALQTPTDITYSIWDAEIVVPSSVQLGYRPCGDADSESAKRSCLMGMDLPEGAVGFAFDQVHGDLRGEVFATDFRELGTIDLAITEFQGASPIVRPAFLNGQQRIELVGGMTTQDLGAFNDGPSQNFLRRHPGVSSTRPVVRSHRRLPSGHQRFIVEYPLSECRACDIVGVALVAYDFSASGLRVRRDYVGIVPDGISTGTTRVLKEEPKALQYALNSLGYLAGPMDGSPGPQTRQALMAFQVEHGVIPTGQPNVQTVRALAQADGFSAACEDARLPTGISANAPLLAGLYVDDLAVCEAERVDGDNFDRIQFIGQGGWGFMDSECSFDRTDIVEGKTRIRGTCRSVESDGTLDVIYDILTNERFFTSEFVGGPTFSRCPADTPLAQGHHLYEDVAAETSTQDGHAQTPSLEEQFSEALQGCKPTTSPAFPRSWGGTRSGPSTVDGRTVSGNNWSLDLWLPGSSSAAATFTNTAGVSVDGFWRSTSTGLCQSYDGKKSWVCHDVLACESDTNRWVMRNADGELSSLVTLRKEDAQPMEPLAPDGSVTATGVGSPLAGESWPGVKKAGDEIVVGIDEAETATLVALLFKHGVTIDALGGALDPSRADEAGYSEMVNESRQREQQFERHEIVLETGMAAMILGPSRQAGTADLCSYNGFLIGSDGSGGLAQLNLVPSYDVQRYSSSGLPQLCFRTDYEPIRQFDARFGLKSSIPEGPIGGTTLPIPMPSDIGARLRTASENGRLRIEYRCRMFQPMQDGRPLHLSQHQGFCAYDTLRLVAIDPESRNWAVATWSITQNGIEGPRTAWRDVERIAPDATTTKNVISPANREFATAEQGRKAIEAILSTFVGQQDDIDLLYRNITPFTTGLAARSAAVFRALGNGKAYTVKGSDSGRADVLIAETAPERRLIHYDAYALDVATAMLGEIADLRVLEIRDVTGSDCEWEATYRTWLAEPTPFAVAVAVVTGREGFTHRACFRTTRQGFEIVRKRLADF